jgi:hypothetical protein
MLPDDLLGRDPVDLLRPRAHEVDAAPRNDEGLESVRSQVGEHLEHRLIDDLGVGTLKFRVAGLRDPIGGNAVELVGRHSHMGGRHELRRTPLALLPKRFHVVLENRLERLLRLPVRMLWRELLHAV